MKRVLFFVLALATAAAAQQPQTQNAPLFPVNAKYVQGVAPGYTPTAGSGLTLNVAGGTAFCSGSVVTYAGTTLTMTPSVTNYIYLNTAASCAPAVKTTAFTSSDIPIATVVAGSSAISSIADDRTMFESGTSSGGSSSGSSYQYVYLPNCSGTGTVLNSWAKYGPGLSVNDQCITVASTADATAGAGAVSLVGIVQAGAGTTGYAKVGVSGVINCQFDSSAAPSQGQYAGLSSAVGGECAADPHTPANENPNVNLFYGTVDTTASAGAVTTVDVSQIPDTYAVQDGWIGPPYLTLLATASYGGGYAVPSILQQTKPTAASGAAIVAGGDFWWPYVNTGFYSVTGPSSLGASGHDFNLLDALSNADPYATPMGRIKASWYVVPDVASVSGTIQSVGGNYWAWGASNLHIWTLTGAATLGPLINDNAGDIQIFDIVQAASGGPYTFTWPTAFKDPPTVSTVASSSTIAAFLFDGTGYNCVWGCPSSGGGGSPTGSASGDLSGSYPGPTVSGLKGVPFCTGFTPTNGQNLQYTTARSPNPCYTAATSGGSSGAPSVTFNIASGVAASPAAYYANAPSTGAISHCYFTTTTSDGSTALIFNIKLAGSNILSGTNATVAAGTSAKTVSVFSLTSTSVSVVQGNQWELDITTGTSSWTGVVQCY